MWGDYRRRIPFAVAVLAGLALTPIGSARAQDAGAFLKGETVRFYVGFSPGGGYDAYARMLAPAFEKRTGATVVVENRPGGGGNTALNQLVRNKPDGLSMMMLNGEGALMYQITKQPGVQYDMAKVSIFGRVALEQHFFLVRPDLQGDLKSIVASGNKLKFSATSRIDNLSDYAAVTCEALAMNCQIITGYKGSKEAGLAVMNGEVDALTISDSSGNDYSQGDRTRVVAAIGNRRSELRPDMPTIDEMFKIPPERRWFLEFRLKAKDFGRVFVGPPGLPADKLAYLQRVWREILTDPEIMAEGAKTQRPLAYETPEKLQQTVRELLQSLTPEKLQEFNEVLLKKFS
ncbi:MAG: tripartite tricarboxylate transporter substrate-binding protein [Bradyrhizobium sp.]